MLNPFFQALRIGPLIRRWLGVLFTLLMVTFVFWAGSWLVLTLPGQCFRAVSIMPCTTEAVQGNAAQSQPKCQHHSRHNPIRHND